MCISWKNHPKRGNHSDSKPKIRKQSQWQSQLQ